MGENPGLLYVVATLLPLASFVLLLLAAGLRNAVRKYQDRFALAGTIYRWLDGDVMRRVPAYIATGAMVLAFLLTLAGFLLFVQDGGHAGHQHAGDAAPEGEAAHGDKWAGKIDPPWIRLGAKENDPRPALVLTLGYRIDHLSAIMFLMVTLVASLIHLFSIGYMADELQPVTEDHQVHTAGGHLRRRGRFGQFFMYLSLFSFAMLNLILADNLFQVFVSWELVGICSYLLIGFYFERTSATNAANKAFITNRIGDAGFIIGLMILWTYVGSLNFEDIFQRMRAPEKDHAGRVLPGQVQGKVTRASVVEEKGEVKRLQIDANGNQALLFPKEVNVDELGPTIPARAGSGFTEYGFMPYWLLVVAGIGIFLGCVGKSAQFPLQVWLPDAMEGPTPVSALIHAATMVAAGVYLVGRCFPLFTEESRLVIAYTGAITLFVAATVAVVMTDIKKVLAYSTVSQLGFMMLALGVGGWTAGLLHLLTHAFFKALLFLGSGSVILGCHHEQEMTKMGGLRLKMPITAATMMVGVLAIAGTPLFSGWYSKDMILAQALGFFLAHKQHFLLFLLPLVTAGITCFYMFRMWFLTFTGKPRDHHVYEHAKESPWVMTLPLVVLAFFSVTVAWGFPLWDAEASQLGRTIEHAQPFAVTADFGTEIGYVHSYHLVAGGLALLAAGLGFVFAYAVYRARVLDPGEAKEQFPATHRFLVHKWYFDEFYSRAVVRPALVVSAWCAWVDTRILDWIIDNTARLTAWVSMWDGRFDNGVIDGIANVIADWTYAVGARLRRVQTGMLRNYILFLALALLGMFVLLSYFVAVAAAR